MKRHFLHSCITFENRSLLISTPTFMRSLFILIASFYKAWGQTLSIAFWWHPTRIRQKIIQRILQEMKNTILLLLHHSLQPINVNTGPSSVILSASESFSLLLSSSSYCIILFWIACNFSAGPLNNAQCTSVLYIIMYIAILRCF